jgi:hypothetical protein
MSGVSEVGDRLGTSVAHAGAALATLLAPPEPPERQEEALASYRSSLEQLQQALLDPERREDEQVQAALSAMTDKALAQARASGKDRSQEVAESVAALGVAVEAFAAGREAPRRSDPLIRATAVALADAAVAASQPPAASEPAPVASHARDPQDFKPVVTALVEIMQQAAGENAAEPLSSRLAEVLQYAGVLAGSPRDRVTIRVYGVALASCLRSEDHEATREAAARVGARAWIEGIDGRTALARSLDAFAAAVRLAGASDAQDACPAEMRESLMTALGLSAAAEAALNAAG